MAAPIILTDEILMDYADGRLDIEMAARVEAAARTNTTLRTRIERFRETGATLARLAAARKAAPVPDTLLARMEEVMATAREAKAAKILPFERPKKRDATASPGAPRRSVFGPMAMAATIALAIGLGSGFWIRGEPGGMAEGIRFGFAALESTAVADALSTLASGQAQAISGGELTVVSSFKDSAGVLCREFEIKQPGQGIVSVACHKAQGWEMRFAAATSNARGYAPVSSMEVLDDYLEHLGASAPLGGEDEAAALKQLD